MNARSKFFAIRVGLFNTPATEEITDCRKHTRTIKFYTGVPKGKRYPYRSKKRGG